MEDYDSTWLDMHEIDALNFRVEQLRALANAMYCVAYLEDGSPGQNYLYHGKGMNKPSAVETLAPLSLISQRLCDEVAYYVHALHHRLGEHEADADTALTDILEQRTHLNPEAQTLLDEIAAILKVATPAEQAILALGVEGVRQQAEQKKAAREASTQGKKQATRAR